MFLTKQGKRIVIFADGTGNAFTTQESNVWRLYEALDKTGTDQIAYYIPGVGTSSFKPYAMLDGATGIGVPSNVRKLYEFICWNWKAGDEIYMFGFSRGSFTIRTLIGLMKSEGLVPAQSGTVPVSRAAMAHNVMAAWRSYRSKAAPWYKYFPTVWIARSIRNVVLFLRDAILRYPRYSTIAAQARNDIPIKFVGLFDTVEAFGVPIEELRTAIDKVLWPISFNNRKLSDKVQRAYHALSLDDERKTFHPLRFDQDNTPPQGKLPELEAKLEATLQNLEGKEKPQREAKPQRPLPIIEEVWFAGVHSDVGGGYPDSALEHVPLAWMLSRATDAAAGNTLRFQTAMTDGYLRAASPLGHCHDSRAGLAVFYRYSPRHIADTLADGGPPVIHHAVAEKMVFGTEGYAPKKLPSTALVLMPDGSKVTIKGFAGAQTEAHRTAMAQAFVDTPMSVAVEAVGKLRGTDDYVVSMVRDHIWWRRVAYFALLFAVIVVASLPVTAPWLFAVERAGLGVASADNLSYIDKADGLLGRIYQVLLAIPSGVFPSYTKPWVTAFFSKPFACTIVVLIAAALYWANAALRDRIADLARQAWFPEKRDNKLKAKITQLHETDAKTKEKSKATFARFMRKSVKIDWLQWLLSDVALLLVLLFFVLSKAFVVIDDGLALNCHETKDAPVLGSNGVVTGEFSTKDYCWASGVKLEQGRHYEVRFDVIEPYFDQALIVDIAGFRDFSPRHILASPLRRSWFADWFAPLAQIAPEGRLEWALESVAGDPPIAVGSDRQGREIPKRIYDTSDKNDFLKQIGKTADEFKNSLGVSSPIPADDLPAANAVAGRFDLGRQFISRFVAQANGELFLYVNDAVFGYPSYRWRFGFLPVPAPGIYKGFYANNSGKAKVTIKRIDD